MSTKDNSRRSLVIDKDGKSTEIKLVHNNDSKSSDKVTKKLDMEEQKKIKVDEKDNNQDILVKIFTFMTEGKKEIVEKLSSVDNKLGTLIEIFEKRENLVQTPETVVKNAKTVVDSVLSGQQSDLIGGMFQMFRNMGVSSELENSMVRDMIQEVTVVEADLDSKNKINENNNKLIDFTDTVPIPSAPDSNKDVLDSALQDFEDNEKIKEVEDDFIEQKEEKKEQNDIDIKKSEKEEKKSSEESKPQKEENQEKDVDNEIYDLQKKVESIINLHPDHKIVVVKDEASAQVPGRGKMDIVIVPKIEEQKEIQSEKKEEKKEEKKTSSVESKDNKSKTSTPSRSESSSKSKIESSKSDSTPVKNSNTKRVIKLDSSDESSSEEQPKKKKLETEIRSRDSSKQSQSNSSKKKLKSDSDSDSDSDRNDKKQTPSKKNVSTPISKKIENKKPESSKKITPKKNNSDSSDSSDSEEDRRKRTPSKKNSKKNDSDDSSENSSRNRRSNKKPQKKHHKISSSSDSNSD